MITKQRLEELIKQQEVVYDIFQGDIYLVDLTMINKLGDVGIEYYNDYYHCNLCRNGSDLFETREDAEWYLEFGNVTRTERLKLPTWNEIKNDFNNINKFGTYSVIEFDGYYMDIFVDNYANKSIIATAQPRMPLTKENYILVCRKAKELFLGENK